eukprot:551997-Prymnesium_polylepis.1
MCIRDRTAARVAEMMAAVVAAVIVMNARLNAVMAAMAGGGGSCLRTTTSRRATTQISTRTGRQGRHAPVVGVTMLLGAPACSLLRGGLG